MKITVDEMPRAKHDCMWADRVVQDNINSVSLDYICRYAAVVKNDKKRYSCPGPTKCPFFTSNK